MRIYLTMTRDIYLRGEGGNHRGKTWYSCTFSDTIQHFFMKMYMVAKKLMFTRFVVSPNIQRIHKYNWFQRYSILLPNSGLINVTCVCAKRNNNFELLTEGIYCSLILGLNDRCRKNRSPRTLQPFGEMPIRIFVRMIFVERIR